jgi:glycosyltransferase involved in cell wall biosynthesis
MGFRTSGIIPARNHQNFVYSSVSSLATQVDQVVAVDDASTDGTWEELRRAASDYPNVLLLRNEKQLGVCQTSNRAAVESKGEILFLQGSDDESLPGRVDSQCVVLSDPEVVLTASMPSVINPTGLELSLAEAPEFQMPTSPREIGAKLFFEGNFVCAPSVAIKAAAWNRLGGYREHLPNLQDYDLWLRATLIGLVHISEEPVVRYRKHGSNMSGDMLHSNREALATAHREKRSILHDFLVAATKSQLVALLELWIGRRNVLEKLTENELRELLRRGHPDLR